MSIWRRNARHDDNHAEIVGVLRAHGCSVQAVNAPGAPDLVVGLKGYDYWVEVKRGKGRLNPTQKAWHSKWNGGKPWVIRSPSDAFEWVMARLEDIHGEGELTTYCTRCERLIPWEGYAEHKKSHVEGTVTEIKR